MAPKINTALFLAFVLSSLAGRGFAADSATPAPASESNATVAAKSTKTVNPDTTFDRARFDAEVTHSKDLPNFHEVHSFLYRSGEPTKLGLEKAKAKGIRTLIDLRGGDRSKQEAEWAKELGLKYINLPMTAEPPTPKQIDTFMSTVKAAEANPKDGSVLVHCAHGSDRTGCMVGIWRVRQDHWDYDKTYTEMRHYWFTPKFTKLSGTVKKFAYESAHR